MGEDFICDPFTAGYIFTSVVLFFIAPLMGAVWATQDHRTQLENQMMTWAAIWVCFYYGFTGFVIYSVARTVVCSI